MLANARHDGIDLLMRMASAAASKVDACIAGPFQLSGCDAVEFRDGFAADELNLESWAIRADDGQVTVSVFAIAPRAGGERMAGRGRFTFTIIPTATGKYHA